MSAKLFFPPGSNGIIPQMDFSANPTENGGWEANQSFLIKRTATKAASKVFVRGTSISSIDPNALDDYRFLTLKKADQDDHSPGVLIIRCTFTGYGRRNNHYR